MYYNIKMFLLWIWSYVVKFYNEFHDWIYLIVSLLVFSATVLCIIIDRSGGVIERDKYNYNVFRCLIYLAMSGILTQYINVNILPPIRNIYTAAREEFLEFSSNGGIPKKKKRKISEDEPFNAWGDEKNQIKISDLYVQDSLREQIERIKQIENRQKESEQIRLEKLRDMTDQLEARRTLEEDALAAYKSGYRQGLENYTKRQKSENLRFDNSIHHPQQNEPTIYDIHPDLDSADPDHAEDLNINIDAVQKTIIELQSELHVSIEANRQRLLDMMNTQRDSILEELRIMNQGMTDKEFNEKLANLKNDLTSEINDNISDKDNKNNQSNY